MSYRIDYSRDGSAVRTNMTCVPDRRSGVLLKLIIICVVAFLAIHYTPLIYRMLPDKTFSSITELKEDLVQGTDLVEAFRDFCQDVLNDAQS